MEEVVSTFRGMKHGHFEFPSALKPFQVANLPWFYTPTAVL